MDVGSNIAEGSQFPHVDESSAFDDKVPTKDRLLCLLDKVEAAVERLRRDALKLEEEKDSLFTTLDTIRNSETLNILAESKCYYYYYYYGLYSLFLRNLFYCIFR